MNSRAYIVSSTSYQLLVQIFIDHIKLSNLRCWSSRNLCLSLVRLHWWNVHGFHKWLVVFALDVHLASLRRWLLLGSSRFFAGWMWCFGSQLLNLFGCWFYFFGRNLQVSILRTFHLISDLQNKKFMKLSHKQPQAHCRTNIRLNFYLHVQMIRDQNNPSFQTCPSLNHP